MFHPSQKENAIRRIEHDLRNIEYYGSVKLYLCFYDDLLVPKDEYNGEYPCSDKSVDLKEVIDIIGQVMKKPYIVRHNILHVDFTGIPAGLIEKEQNPLSYYIDVCVVNTPKE